MGPGDIDRQRQRKAKVMPVLDAHPFVAPVWLRNAHAQTIWAPVFRRPPRVPRRIERVETPDGDFLDLHVAEGARENPGVLLLHGLEGSAHSKYILGVSDKLRSIGWSAICMEFRGCSGEMNHGRRLYHSGETGDLAFVASQLSTRYSRLYIAGFSLGGNVLVKWLGESARAVPANVYAAAAVSVPYDLMVSGPNIDQVLGGLYSRHFLRSLVQKAEMKERQHPGSLDMDRVRGARTLYEFDNHATAALHGFADADHYYRTQRSGQFLGGVRIPTLLLSAADDPFNPASTLPRSLADQSVYLHPQFTERGGHVGFVYGTPFAPRYWAEEQTVRFFQAYDELENHGGKDN